MKRPLLFAALSCFITSLAYSQVLVTIDISNPFAVTFTATGAFPSVVASEASSSGVTFLNFYQTSNSGTIDLTGSFLANGMTQSYAFAEAWNFEGGDFDGTGLNLWRGSAGTQTFDTALPAFYGVSTGDFSSFLASLPSVGHSGNIMAGDGPTGAAIGTYSVVPEPTAMGFIALGGTVCLTFRRRRIS